ncbi:MAG TPA: AMP-binding protein [Acidimicrobiia bacterium]
MDWLPDEVSRSEIAIHDRDRIIRWGELVRAVNRGANWLLREDLGPDRRVAIFAENSAETAMAYLACLLGGASAVPVSFHLSADEAAYILADSNAATVFVGPENVRVGTEAAAAAAAVRHVVGWGPVEGSAPGFIPWEQFLAEEDDASPPGDVHPRPNLMYTSGTTGRPKGTALPTSMFAPGDTVEDYLGGLRIAQPFARWGMHLVAGPLYHTGPMTAVRLLAAGKPLSLIGRFDAQRALAAIAADHVESTVMVPTHFIRLLSLPDDVRARYDVSSLKLVAQTGAACPLDVKLAMIEWWGPVFLEAYGATEVGTICQISSKEWLSHRGSVGRCLPRFEPLVVDDEGAPVPVGTDGTLYFRDLTGRGIVYHNDVEKSLAAHLEPGVFTIGEIGHVDADGYVYITDRLSDMVVSGGVNLYPAESEAVLLQHPAVADVAVIGIPHPEMGEQLKALVVSADPAAPPTEDELVAFCRDRLSSLKCPRSVDIVESVGRNSAGKVNKRELRNAYLEQ